MRLPPEIQAELETCGMPWSIEYGTKHRKLVVGGRMVGILPLNLNKSNTSSQRALKNTLSQVRRAIRQTKGTL